MSNDQKDKSEIFPVESKHSFEPMSSLMTVIIDAKGGTVQVMQEIESMEPHIVTFTKEQFVEVARILEGRLIGKISKDTLEYRRSGDQMIALIRDRENVLLTILESELKLWQFLHSLDLPSLKKHLVNPSQVPFRNKTQQDTWLLLKCIITSVYSLIQERKVTVE